MITNSSSLQRLVSELKKLPSIGERTATRLAFHLLKSRSNITALSDALLEVRDKVKPCANCFALTDHDLCDICSGDRDSSLICVVETSQDMIALERCNSYGGLYHILGGALSPLNGVTADDLHIQELLGRIRNGRVEEVVIATNFSVEGEATALYLQKVLKPLGCRITRLAHGIPLGSDIEFVDAATVQWALQGRKEL